MNGVSSIALVVALFVVPSTGQQLPTTKPKAARSNEVKMALSCAARTEWGKAAIKNLGIRLNQRIETRATKGSIDGTSPENPVRLNVIVYAPNRKSALLLFSEQARDKTEVARNYYSLRRKDDDWVVLEGNGGVSTYAAVSSFVRSQGHHHTMAITIDNQAKYCAEAP